MVNAMLMFLLLGALGWLCFRFLYRCIDWFEKI